MWINDIRIAFASLRSARVRTALTVLGVVIGVTSITTILAFGNGAQHMMTDQISQFGGNVLSVRSGKIFRDAQGNATNYDVLAGLTSSTLSDSDARIVAASPNVQTSAPIMNMRGAIKSVDKNFDDVAVVASNQSMLEVLNQKLKIGEFVHPELSKNTIVLGDTLAVNLLGSDQTIGQRITLRGEEYTLIGVLKHNEIPLYINGIVDLNNSAFVSLEAGRAMSGNSLQYQAINFRLKDQSQLAETKKEVEASLAAAHGASDVSVIGQQEASNITQSVFSSLILYTTAVAGIALLVAGISIMNIMLVSVSERTKEIGIRKAIGATNGQVLRQFMIEAIAMSLGGGIVGLGLSYAICIFVQFQFGFMPIIDWQTAVLAPSIALAVGTLFGIYPAIKAARKDPIESLRQLS